MNNTKYFFNLVILVIIFTLTGCTSNYDKGIKLFNDNKFKEAIEEFSKINPGENKYEESKEITNNCYYKISVVFIKEDKIDSALFILSKVNKESKIFSKTKSVVNYCNASKSIEKNNQKEALAFLKDVQADCEFYLETQNKIKENEVKYDSKPMTFNEFANEFLSNGITSFDKFKTYCDDKILSADCGGPEIIAKKDIVYKYVKEYIKSKNYHFRAHEIEIKKSQQDYILLSFKKNGSTWKIYKFLFTC